MEKLSELMIPIKSKLETERKQMNTLNIISLGDLAEPPPMEYVIDDFIPSGHVTTLYGDGGQGKSYIALAMASCVAMGRQFLNRDTMQGKVLYVDFELEETEQARRAYKIARGLNISRPPKHNLLYCSPEQDLKKTLSELEKIVKEEQIVLTIIDSFGAAVKGDAESARDVCDLFHRLRRLGTVLMLDHQSKLSGGDKYKDKTAFGSVYKQNLSRNVWQLQMFDSKDSELMLALNHKKSNFGELKDPIGFTAKFGQSFILIETGISAEHAKEVADSKAQVLLAFEELKEATAETVMKKTELAESTVRNAITSLLKCGKLEKCGKNGKATIYRLSVCTL